MDAAPNKTLLARLADYIEDRQTAVTQQWLDAISADAEMDTSHHLTHQQLIDHLPVLYKELCSFLRLREAAQLTGEITQDARKHGEHRWKNGYRIEELLREINILRRIVLATFVTMFADANPTFSGSVEITARQLIGEFFGVLTLNSVDQFVREQQEQVAGYTQKLETANRHLELHNGRLTGQMSSRLQLTGKAAQELRQLMQIFSDSLQILQTAPTNVQSFATVRHQAANMEILIGQLCEYSNLLHAPYPVRTECIDLKEIYTKLLERNEPSINRAGHSLKKEFAESLRTVISDEPKIKQIGTNMLAHALRYTREKEIEWAFLPVDAERWMMRVVYGSKPVNSQGETDETGTTPLDDLGFAIVKELAALLGGTVRLISTEDIGTRFEVILPYRRE